ncbi:MAG: EcsC family protein [Candidatus Omnitrophica bacterium]|nr:EcsC family protein [Candidatus Omnitrophota bacterium]
MKLNDYERTSLSEIFLWEKSKHTGFHKKILEVLSRPAEELIRKIGEDRFAEFEKHVERAVRTFISASTFTVNPQVIIRRARQNGVMIESIADIPYCDLKLLDECNRKHIKFHERASAIQGGVAGLGGFLTSMADLATVLVSMFHMVQEVAYCYAYDPNNLVEKQIIIHIVTAGLGNSQVKFKSLAEIRKLEKVTGRRRQATIHKTRVLGGKAINEAVETITVSLMGRLLKRAVPILSVAVSAHNNHEIMEHAGNTAFMVYRRRFIQRKPKLRHACPAGAGRHKARSTGSTLSTPRRSRKQSV